MHFDPLGAQNSVFNSTHPDTTHLSR